MRLLTAIVLIGICGFVVARGWSIVHFSVAMANIDESAKPAEIINTWTAAPDVTSAALRAKLREKIDTSDPKAAEDRREALWSMLSISPLSSDAWLSLSVTRLVMGLPMEQALKSLKLSVVTGPNEGKVMADRGTFGVSIWNSLTSDLKTRVAADLITADLSENKRIRAILSAEPKRVRQELQETLRASGFSSKEIEQRLGL
jgi:hypothetical protein